MVSTAKTRLERRFDPEVARQLKAEATRDITVGGPALAAHAIRAGLVDEYHVFVTPIIVGSGNPYLSGKVRIELELIGARFRQWDGSRTLPCEELIVWVISPSSTRDRRQAD
jgi:riboflavin biosynthesis pyrimidine reductase